MVNPEGLLSPLGEASQAGGFPLPSWSLVWNVITRETWSYDCVCAVSGTHTSNLGKAWLGCHIGWVEADFRMGNQVCVPSLSALLGGAAVLMKTLAFSALEEGKEGVEATAV